MLTRQSPKRRKIIGCVWFWVGYKGEGDVVTRLCDGVYMFMYGSDNHSAKKEFLESRVVRHGLSLISF